MLTIEKYMSYEDNVAEVLASGKNATTGAPIDAESLEKTLDITFEEFFRYQEEQALAHASGKISPEVAMVIYRALGGEVHSTRNGGWASGVSLARKVTITNLIGELLTRRVAA